MRNEHRDTTREKRISRIRTTRIAGGLLLGCNPMGPGQGLKSLA